MDAIQLASERWPGVSSAVFLYQNLIHAVLQIYEKDGDVPISAATPSDQASPAAMFPDAFNRSRTTSPATVSSTSVSTPPGQPPFGHFQQPHRGSVEQPPPVPYQSDTHQMSSLTSHQTPPINPSALHHSSSESVQTQQTLQQQPHMSQQMPFDPNLPFNPLPEWTSDLTIPSWSAPQNQQMHYGTASAMPMQSQYNGYANPAFDQNSMAYPFLISSDQQLNDQYTWDMDVGSFGSGLNQLQQEELMHSLETDGMEDIQSMITAVQASITPKQPSNPTFQ